MLAVRYYAPQDVRVEDIPQPQPVNGQALIRVIYGGLCGSDLHIWRQGMFMTYAPETLGHEFIGRIETAPPESGLVKGDLVTGHPGIYCGECGSCRSGDLLHCLGISFIGESRPGAFAEYIALETDKLIKFNNPEVNLLQAAVVEPVTVALHAVKRIACRPGEHIAIFGAGPIGLLIAYLLKQLSQPASVSIIDIDPYRREQAQKCGADEVLANYQESRYDNFQRVVDCAGAETVLNLALEAVAPDGVIFVTALYEKLPVVDFNLMVNKEITITGNNAYTFAEMEEAVQLVGSGNFDFSWLVSKVVPAREAANAFASLAGATKQDIKILLDFAHN